MKATTEIFNTAHSKPASQSAKKHRKASHSHYLLAVALFAVAYLFAIWVSSAPSTAATAHTGAGFIFFWLGGGLVTLALLTLAAKR